MRIRMTRQRRITLPESLLAELRNPACFNVRTEAGRILLEPFFPQRAEAVRAKLAGLGIGEQDIANGIDRARSRKA